MRVALYVRVSRDDFQKGKRTREQQEADASVSIRAQLDEGLALIEREGWTLVGDPLVDDGVSGYKTRKADSGYGRLLTRILAQEVDLVLVRAADRLGRNDEENIAARLAMARNGVRLALPNGTITDPSTASGALTMTVEQGIAAYQSAVKSEAIRNVNKRRAADGEIQAPPGTFGYDDADRSRIVPWEAALIRQAYVDVADGVTVGSIVRRWNLDGVPMRRGGSRWTYAHVNSILRRPRNAGLVAHRGAILDGVTGQWEAIVDLDLWHEVQAILDSRHKRSEAGFNSLRWVTSGIARCGVCGSVMRSNTAVDKRRGTRTPILRCSAVKGGERHASARLEDLEPLVRDAVVTHFIFSGDDLQERHAPDLAPLRAQQTALAEQRGELLELRAEGLLTAADLRDRLASIKDKDAALKKAIQDALSASLEARMTIDLRDGLIVPHSDGKTQIDLAVAGDLQAALRTRWDALAIEQQRALVDSLFNIQVQPGRDRGEKYSIIRRANSAT